jgi:hypothetical protein
MSLMNETTRLALVGFAALLLASTVATLRADTVVIERVPGRKRTFKKWIRQAKIQCLYGESGNRLVLVP